MQYIITQIHELKRNVMIIAASEEPFSRILFTNIDYHTIATNSITFYTMILTFYIIIKVPKL